MSVRQQKSGPMSSPGDCGSWAGLALRMLTSSNGLGTSVLFWLWICSALTPLSVTAEQHLPFAFSRAESGNGVSGSKSCLCLIPSSQDNTEKTINVHKLNEWFNEWMCKLSAGFCLFHHLHWHCHSALNKFGLTSREKTYLTKSLPSTHCTFSHFFLPETLFYDTTGKFRKIEWVLKWQQIISGNFKIQIAIFWLKSSWSLHTPWHFSAVEGGAS